MSLKLDFFYMSLFHSGMQNGGILYRYTAFLSGEHLFYTTNFCVLVKFFFIFYVYFYMPLYGITSHSSVTNFTKKMLVFPHSCCLLDSLEETDLQSN